MSELLTWFILLIIWWIWTVLWTYRKEISLILKRIKLEVFPATFNVAFSIEFKEWLNSWEYFNELKKNFNKIILEENLDNTIKIKDFSDIYLFKNQNEAENFRENKDLDLIIWWDFSNDNLKENWKKLNRLNLKYTYCILNDDKWNIWNLVKNDLSTKFAEKNYWTIYEENSYKDIQIVWNNLSDMALYILSVSLKFQWNLFKSTEILEKHLNNLLKRNDNFVQHIKFHLLNNYKLFILDIIFNVKKYWNKKDFKSWTKYCEKMLKLYENDFFALTNLAYFEYNLWNKFRVKKIIEIIEDLYSKSPCSITNIAFLHLINNKYKVSYKWYNKLSKYNINQLDFNPIDVIPFLYNEYKKTLNPWLYFASWFLQYLYWDKSIAKKDLSNFIKIVDKEKAKLMYNKAEKILQYL